METPCAECKKIPKLIDRIRQFLSRLDSYDLGIHHRIDEFYYLTKVEELRILLKQYEENDQASVRMITIRYAQVFHQWRKDARWLNTYRRLR